MAKTTSQKGIKAIALREGTVLHGYKDSKGLLTIGVGHLVRPGEPYKLGGKITQAESDRLLAADLAEAEAAVNSVKAPLTQNQFDALVSFVVNIGVGGFKKSSVLKRLNEKDYDGAAKAMMFWVKPPEITGRRKNEQKQFLTKDAPAGVSAKPILNATGNLGSAPVENPDRSNSNLTEGQGLASAGQAEPQNINQQADTIVNAGDVAPDFVPETKEQKDPEKTGFLTKLTGGLTLTTIAGGIIWALQQITGLEFKPETVELLKFVIPLILQYAFIGLVIWFVVANAKRVFMWWTQVKINTDPTKHNLEREK